MIVPLGYPLAHPDKMAWPLMGWWPIRRNRGGGACTGCWAATLPIDGEPAARPGREGALEQEQRVGDPIWGRRGGVAHWSSALHTSTDRSVGNDGEGGLLVVGVDNSRFGNVAEAQAVGVGRGPRRQPPVMPQWRME
jgi:hypothetical protein